MDLDSPITTQEDLQERINAALADRLARERAKFSDYEDLKAFKADAQTTLDDARQKIVDLEGKVTEVTGALTAKDAEVVRARVAASKGVPEKWLQGDTLEAIEKSAEEWLVDAKSTRKVGSVPTQGTGDPGTNLSPFQAGRDRALAKYQTPERGQQ